MKIILASGSPRRRELLERAGWSFEVRPSPAEESRDGSLGMVALCEGNAVIKVRGLGKVDGTVIGADTLVFLDDQPLGKPQDMEEARAMLRRLSGRWHTVCTGVCLGFPDGREETFHARTGVRFRELDDAMIVAYHARVDPLDKAGGYAIQEHGEMLVAEVDGDWDNVIGLPVAMLVARLKACHDVENRVN